MKKVIRKKKEKERHQEEILEVAEKLFAKKGFHKTTIQDIANEAGFSVGHIYNFFKSKDALYKFLATKKVKIITDLLKEISKSNATPKNKLTKIITSLLNYFENNKDSFRIYVSETKGHAWNFKKEIDKDIILKAHEEVHKYINEIFKEGIKQNIFIKTEPQFLTLALTGIINSFITYWITSSITTSLVDKAHIIQKILFESIETKGQK